MLTKREADRRVQIAADSVAKLRRSDVERVIDDADLVAYLDEHRPDLREEIDELLGRPSRTGTDNGWGDDGQRLTWEGYDA